MEGSWIKEARDGFKHCNYPTKGTYCKVCSVPLNGTATAKQHFKSAKHLKRAAVGAQQAPAQMPAPPGAGQSPPRRASPPLGITQGQCAFIGCLYHCTVCDVHITGEDNKDQHVAGSKHAKKLASAAFSPSASNQTLPMMLADTSQQDVARAATPEPVVRQMTPPYTPVGAAGPSPVAQSSPPRRTGSPGAGVTQGQCRMIGCLYHCTVCAVCIPGEDNKVQHLAGAKHAKKLAISAYTPGMMNVAAPAPYTILPAPYTTVPSAYTATPSPYTATTPALNNTALASAPSAVSGEYNLNLTTNDGSPESIHKSQHFGSQAAQPTVTSGASEKDQYHFDNFTRRGVCYVCNNLELTSLDHATQHLGGANHLKKIRQHDVMKIVQTTPPAGDAPPYAYGAKPAAVFADPGGIDRTLWHECHVCKKRLNSEQQLSIHMHSHPAGGAPMAPPYAQVAVTQAQVAVTQAQVAVTQAQVAPPYGQVASPLVPAPGAIDQTVWYECPVCRKRLNSPEQLRTHQQSHGGLAAGPLAAAPAPMMPTGVAMTTPQFGQPGAKPSIPSALFANEAAPALNNLNLSSADVYADPGQTHLRQPELESAPSYAHRLNLTLASATYRPPPENPEDAITTGVCAHPGCYYHCTVCEQHISGDENRVQHLRGRVHERNVRRMGVGAQVTSGAGEDAPTSDAMMNIIAGFDMFCWICQIPYNADSHDAHMKGKKHMAAAAKSKAAPAACTTAPVHKYADEPKCYDTADELVDKIPRGYQVELYCKAMQADTVIFLPTGTGKTLISCMVMSHMLMNNPSRPVVFLVDKVLLVLQQSKVIKEELGCLKYPRGEDGEKRELRIASVCGDRHDTQGLALYQQDIIVATADYYRNLLDREILRWTDNCLVVFDEAHHCTKTHPFNVILRNYHVAAAYEERPKVLGLTASPAGQESVEGTRHMLVQLLRNIGGGQLAMVEAEVAVSELRKYQSDSQLVPVEVGHSEAERDLARALHVYLVQVYTRLAAHTNFSLTAHAPLPKTDDAQPQFDGSTLGALQEAMDGVRPRTAGDHVPAENLKAHVRHLCSALLSLNEMGLGAAYQELEMLQENRLGCLPAMRQLGLPCAAVEQLVADFAERRRRQMASGGAPCDPHSDPAVMPAITQLIRELQTRVDWGQTPRPIALVLVQRRRDAHQLAAILGEEPQLAARGLSTVCLVGHGSGGGEAGGMAVNKQDRILAEIKQLKHQIVVATSVAEEGVDMPACELVVQMDPPNNVRALVQLRGRARKKVSTFIALCRNAEQRVAIEDLLQREQHMIQAVGQMVQEQRILNTTA